MIWTYFLQKEILYSFCGFYRKICVYITPSQKKVYKPNLIFFALFVEGDILATNYGEESNKIVILVVYLCGFV